MKAVKKLEVLAIPFYFATMGAEYLHHRARRPQVGPLPGDYERRDTLTSLAMGTGSLLVPLVAPKLLAPITPGKGRYAKVLVGGAVAAVATTVVADLVARRAEAEVDAESTRAVALAPVPSPSRASRRARIARRVGSVSGVAALATIHRR